MYVKKDYSSPLDIKGDNYLCFMWVTLVIRLAFIVFVGILFNEPLVSF